MKIQLTRRAFLKYAGIVSGAIFSGVVKTSEAQPRRDNSIMEPIPIPTTTRVPGHYFPLIHVVIGETTSWGEAPIPAAKFPIHIKNNGLKTSPFVVVDIYEANVSIFHKTQASPGDAVLCSRRHINTLHPGKEKGIEFSYPLIPVDSIMLAHNPQAYNKIFIVSAYDPVLDPKAPLTTYPQNFPKFHVKNNFTKKNYLFS